MNPILRNVLAVIGGIVVGSIVNMGIIILSDGIVSAPEGVDVTNAESLKESMHLFRPINFIFPFLAHAIGTLSGAYTAVRFSVNKELKMALIIGAFFLLGGIMMIYQVGGPTWFTILDLVGAYIPMAWLGHYLVKRPNVIM